MHARRPEGPRIRSDRRSGSPLRADAAWRGAASRSSSPRPMRGPSRRAGGDGRNGALPARPADRRCRRSRISTRSSTSLAVEGRVLEPQPLVAFANFLAVDRHRPAHAIRRAEQRLVRFLRAIADGPRRSSGRSPTSAARSDPTTRSSTMPARSWRRCGIGCGSSARGCEARSSRTCAAATRRSICSSRSSPIATAATSWSSAASIGARSPASSMAAPAAARACSSSRSAPSRSTTRSSRSNSRSTEEVRRILLALADAFRERAADLHAYRRRRHRARSCCRPARASRCSSPAAQPAIASDGRLELRGARHPLLHSGRSPASR